MDSLCASFYHELSEAASCVILQRKVLFCSAVGADLIAGSLIKNPGGSIAPGGGYVAGREDLVDAAAARLSAPGIGREAGATPSSVQRLMLQVGSTSSAAPLQNGM